MRAGGTRGSKVRRRLLSAIAVAGAALLLLAGLAAAILPAGGALFLAAMAAAGLGIAALWIAIDLAAAHFRALARLRDDLVVAGSAGGPLPPRYREAELAGSEVGALAAAAAAILSRERGAREAPDSRLAAVIGAAAEGFIVVTESGLISLVNAAALDRFGSERVRLGTTIFDAFERHSVSAAMAAAERATGAVDLSLTTPDGHAVAARAASLGAERGVVFSFADAVRACPPAVQHDLALHDRPPPAAPADAETPLDRLPALVLDTETTGLDVERDRILAIGAVRLHGARLYPQESLDWLVDPGVPIPPAATAVHGITEAMVAGAPAIRAILPRLQPLLDGSLVLVGHQIGFDLRMIEGELRRLGEPWRAPPSLDTARLAAMLFPDLADLNLESVAAHLGVEARGRHTALGDALMTAEIYVRLLPLLAERGVRTLGAALAFAERPRALVARQRAAGW